ncbi:MAG: 50S ribosomal protein L25 [Candidatus Pacebacteria bacterium]|nr:50S ribosomal protein L25 [Candidatus Paceibacterota bacterium]
MLSLIVEKREKLKEKTDFLRKDNLLPAVVYGKELGNIPIKTNYNDFRGAYEEAGESTIIKLKMKGDKEEEYPVLIREVQKDPLSGEFLHADFFQLPMNEEVEVTVPLDFKGESPAEKELGGVLIKNLHEIEIKALPNNLVHSIEVDVSSLAQLDDEIKIKDLVVPEQVKILAEPDEIVAVVGRVKEEKIEEEPEEEKIEDIEVVGEKKEEGEEGEEVAEGKEETKVPEEATKKEADKKDNSKK